MFCHDGSHWFQDRKLLPSDGAAHDLFGRAVATDAGTAVVGMLDDDEGGRDTGSAYVFSLCFGDLDGDGAIGLPDLASLLSNYGAPTDATYGDGDVDLEDLAALLTVYGPTCE